ncbi:MAG: hypothetical protein AB7T49_10050 [Oligoflexales bacterium]
MKLRYAFWAFTTLLMSCGAQNNNSSSRISSHEQLTEEEYYDKFTHYMSLLPCAESATREGDVVTVAIKEGSTPDKCYLGQAPLLFQIEDRSPTTIRIKMFKTSSQELVIDTIKRMVPCATEAVATERGFELTLVPGENNDGCLSFINYYFDVIEKSETKLVLGYLSKGFQCKTDDRAITIDNYKDFGHPHFSDVFDIFSSATVTMTKADGTADIVNLDHCDAEIKRIPDENIPRGVYYCESSSKNVNIRHELRFGPWSFSQILVVDGVEQPTSCRWPEMMPQ